MKIVDYTGLSWTYSSNISSGGQYLKSELVLSDKKYYLKLSDYLYGTFISHEAILEIIASRLGIYLGFPVLKYTGSLAYIILDGKQRTEYVSKSLNYCKSGNTTMPLVTYFKLNKLSQETPLEFCSRIGISDYVNCILIFDYLIKNVDRHGKNIELLISNKGVVPAPIFDNGRCLTYACGNNIENIQKFNYAESGQGNNFIGGINLENNLRYVTQVYKLPKLTSEFKKKLFYGLNSVLQKEHMDIIWEAITHRYKVLQNRGVIL